MSNPHALCKKLKPMETNDIHVHVGATHLKEHCNDHLSLLFPLLSKAKERRTVLWHHLFCLEMKTNVRFHIPNN